MTVKEMAEKVGVDLEIKQGDIWKTKLGVYVILKTGKELYGCNFLVAEVLILRPNSLSDGWITDAVGVNIELSRLRFRLKTANAKKVGNF